MFLIDEIQFLFIPITGMFSDTDIVDAPGRVEPADTVRDQTGTVCSGEINILLERRGDIYRYLHISRYIYSISTECGTTVTWPGARRHSLIFSGDTGPPAARRWEGAPRRS